MLLVPRLGTNPCAWPGPATAPALSPDATLPCGSEVGNRLRELPPFGLPGSPRVTEENVRHRLGEGQPKTLLRFRGPVGDFARASCRLPAPSQSRAGPHPSPRHDPPPPPLPPAAR